MKNLYKNKIFSGLALAIFLPAAALLLQILLESLIGTREWLFFYPAIFTVAWFRGAIFGYLATIFSIILTVLLLIPPLYSFQVITSGSFIEIIIFLFMGLSTSFMIGKLRSTAIATASYTEDLENFTIYLNSLLDNIPLMVTVKDTKDLRFTHFNKAGEELLGLKRSEIIGKNDYDIFPKEQADFFTSKDRETILSGKISEIEKELIQTKHFGNRILHTKKIPLNLKDGKSQYLLCVSEDVTEKKKAEEEILRIAKEEAAIKERERATSREAFLAKVSTLISSSLDYNETLSLLANLSITALGDWCTIAILNEEGQFLRATSAHIDKTKSHLIDEYTNNYPPDERVFIVNNGSSYYNYQIQDSQLEKMVKDARQLEILKELGANSSMIVPITTRGKIHGSLSFIAGKSKPNFSPSDLSLAEELGKRAGIALENAKLYSSAQSAIKARDEFVSIASHELKTPITSLKMQIQMLMRGISPEKNLTPTPEKLLKGLQNSNNQIERLTVLIDDLLDATRIETGKLTYKFEEVNLSLLVAEVLERFLDSTHCKIEQNIESSTMVYCDRYRIEQVIVNLLSNAIKYGVNNPIDVSVLKESGTAIIVVKDHGMGIANDMQAKIFERFERAISSSHISGLGLGLYITRQIIDAHQGSIEVDSVLNLGSTFKVRLPTGI